MNIIKDNPYRILGVTANARMGEIQKNISKVSAYLSIGKAISFGFDDDFFGQVVRDNDNITKAKNELQLDENRIENALFWLIEANEIDSVANENIRKGKIDKAFEIWEKKVAKSSINKENFSAYNNLGTLLFLKERYSEAIRLKSNLLDSEYIKNFGRVVCDDNFQVNTSSLKDSFINKMIISLSNAGIKESKVIELFSESSESIKNAVTNKFVQTPISNLDKSIEEASTLLKKGMPNPDKFSNRKGGDIGRDLMNKTKNDINQLKIILGVNHFNYKLYSDKLAIQLEQCGVAYFNANSDDYDYLDVYKYALKIAEGEHAKSKLKDAINHSNLIEERNRCWFCGVNKITDGCEARFQMHKWEKPKNFGSSINFSSMFQEQPRRYTYFQDGGLPLGRCRSCFDNHEEFVLVKLFKWIKGESGPIIKKDNYQTKRRHPDVLQKIKEGYEPGLPSEN